MAQNGLLCADVSLRKLLTHGQCIVASWDSCVMSHSVNWQALYVCTSSEGVPIECCPWLDVDISSLLLTNYCHSLNWNACEVLKSIAEQ